MQTSQEEFLKMNKRCPCALTGILSDFSTAFRRVQIYHAKTLTRFQQAASLTHHYDLYVRQYVNTALPHFLRLDCPTLP